jgi:hypothetical protein
VIDDILKIWDQIRKHHSGAEGINAKPLYIEGLIGSDVLLCITTDGNPGILLRNPGGSAQLPKPGCGRLIVKREQLLKQGSQPEEYIRLECLDLELIQPFAMLASQVVGYLAAGATPSNACIEAVLIFRKLLSKRGGILPTDEEIVGLTGELLLIRTLVSVDPNLWRGWNGPLGSSKDFSWGTIDIEAKASRMAGESSLTINGLDQLEPEQGRELLVHHCVLTSNLMGSVDVPTMADEIRRCISDQDEFEARLSSAGYLEEQRDLWLEHRFTLHESSFYNVLDEFPRIRKKDFPGGVLPQGVAKLRYDILLSNCSKFRLTPKEEEVLLTKLASTKKDR